MSKSDPASKNELRKSIKWVITIFLVTIVVSGLISFASDKVMSASGMVVAFIILFRSFRAEAGSDLDTVINPFCFIYCDGSRQDKSYGLGRVGFPRTEPAVAAQAVSV